jgi:hypothetical protein
MVSATNEGKVVQLLICTCPIKVNRLFGGALANLYLLIVHAMVF